MIYLQFILLYMLYYISKYIVIFRFIIKHIDNSDQNLLIRNKNVIIKIKILEFFLIIKILFKLQLKQI